MLFQSKTKLFEQTYFSSSVIWNSEYNKMVDNQNSFVHCSKSWLVV